MSFTAKLGSDELSVDAGATTPVSIEISNKAEEAVEFELNIEGLDGEWTAIPVPLVKIGPGETQIEKVFVKPPRTSESASGNYPFIITVRSFESNESKTLPITLQIKPFNLISVDIDPKRRSVSSWSKSTDFEVSVSNLGNSTHTLKVFAGDPDDSCLYDLEEEQLALMPGQQKSVELSVSPKRKKWLSGRLFGFSLTARSIENPNVMASTQAQIEQKPALNMATLIAIVILGFLAALWIALIPKPPLFKMTLSTTDAQVGKPITITWSPATSNENVVIYAQDGQIYSDSGLAGATTFTPVAPGSVQIRGYAVVDGRKSIEESVNVTVTTPPVILPPKIDEFQVDSSTLTLGLPFTIHYKVENATKLILLPLGKELDPSLGEIQVVADNVQTKTYTLVATNSQGLVDRKKVNVRVVQPSQAKIIAFDANPASLDLPGPATLTWQVNDKAVRVELASNGVVQVEPSSGSVSVNIDKTTTYTLTAYDEQGITVVKVVKIVVKPIPPVNPANPTSSGQPTAGGTAGDTGGSGGAVGDSSGNSPGGQ